LYCGVSTIVYAPFSAIFLKIAGELIAGRDMLCPALMTFTILKLPPLYTDVNYAFLERRSRIVRLNHTFLRYLFSAVVASSRGYDPRAINLSSTVKICLTIHGVSRMEIDVNIEAHDLLWRSMSLGIKKGLSRKLRRGAA
jgi:hypothetical protein